jgi:hypothetical protein
MHHLSSEYRGFDAKGPAWWLCVFGVLLGAAGCHETHSSSERARPSGKPASSDNHVNLEAPYPKGRWRLAPDQLGDVVLWVSHVLVRHDGVGRRTPFELVSWPALPPAPSRTREVARKLALELARRAEQNPSGFAELARRYSEDIATAAQGGSLGGQSAVVFRAYPQVLDALSAMSPGQTSRVIETRYGFHILQLRAPPPEQLVAGRRIVIGYDGLPFRESAPDLKSPLTARSREQAEALAANVARELADDPTRFAALAERDSDYAPEAGSTELRTWSIREPNGFARELETLAQVPVGGITSPIDSFMGFEVLQRMAASPIESRYVELIHIPYRVEVPPAIARAGEAAGQLDPGRQGAPTRTRSEALALMRSVMHTLHDSPQLFGRFQKTYCCDGAVRFVRSRLGEGGLAETVMHMDPGTIAAEPIEQSSEFVLARRLSQQDEDAQHIAAFALPAPKVPDVMRLAERARGPAVQALISEFATHAVRALELSEARADEFARLHDRMLAMFALSSPEANRSLALEDIQARLRKLLSADEYEQYTHLLEGYVAAALLR